MMAPSADSPIVLTADNAEGEVWETGRYLVISDLHLGSRYCLRDELVGLMDRLPPDMTLVLNGDAVDRVHENLPAVDLAVLKRLGEESRRREILWIYGNHDAGFRFEQSQNIRFLEEVVIEETLYVAHGDRFDAVMPAHRWFVRTFRFMHHMRMAMGAEAVHVAAYAKRWERLYRILRHHVQRKAIRHARRRGCTAVTCGHTHFADAKCVHGIWYYNTGSWTELPVYGVCVGAAGVRMLKLAG